MAKTVLIAGAGIGGLAAALACARAGSSVQLMERAAVLAEVGAGVQLGPNVVKILHGWGLEEQLAAVAAFPGRLQVRSAVTGELLGQLPLGARAVRRYGAPYATVHRADLQQLLLQAVRHRAEVALATDCEVLEVVDVNAQEGVHVRTRHGGARGDMLVGADGLWSRVRQQLWADGPPRPTGHLAYRAIVPQDDLPQRLRSDQVTVWLGPRLHLVHYPVQAGRGLNVVGIVQGRAPDDLQNWDHGTNASNLRAALAGMCPSLVELVAAVPQWRLWALCERAPMASAREQAHGRVALLGDAAHPMRPYLAQGAGMAIEDAAELERVLRAGARQDSDAAALLALYAQRRWQRNARVQARATRNGEIFHATGFLRWGRDLSMRWLGARLLDLPWLYRG